MGIWTVWENDKFEPASRPENAEFVKDSFSWLAFLFPPLWLIANRMWVLFVLSAVIVGGVIAAAPIIDPGPAIAVAAVLMLWFGFEARALKRWSLARRGWTLTGVVEGARFRNAERRYFSERVVEGPGAAVRGRTSPPAAVPPRGRSGRESRPEDEGREGRPEDEGRESRPESEGRASGPNMTVGAGEGPR